jgi:hypothetical protein
VIAQANTRSMTFEFAVDIFHAVHHSEFVLSNPDAVITWMFLASVVGISAA